MRSTESQRMATSAEILRSSNFCLKSTVQELRLEIAYYQGEAKRLEWEKNVLKQDLGKMSALFKGWLDLLQCSNNRSIVDETEYFKNLVKNPTKNISEILQMNDLKLLVTTCQAPFFIEHANKAWSLECGWDSHEVLGLTCAFLQGEVSLPPLHVTSLLLRSQLSGSTSSDVFSVMSSNIMYFPRKILMTFFSLISD